MVSPSATDTPSASPTATADAGLAPTSSHTGTGGNGWLLPFGIVLFFLICGGAAFGGAYIRRRA
jgi:hypothetical protein